MIGDLVHCRLPVRGRRVSRERLVLVVARVGQRREWDVLPVRRRATAGDAVPLTPADFAEGSAPTGASVSLADSLRVTSAQLGRRTGRLTAAALAALLKRDLLVRTRTFAALAHAGQRPGDDPQRPPFTGGTVPYAGRVFDEDEVEAAVGSTLDFWLTLGPEGTAFERELAARLGVRHTLLTNSGSSANLLAVATLTSPKLPAHRRLLPGDEVITAAAGFPTTVAPIVQLGAVPVFIDSDPLTGNIRPDQLAAAYSPGRTKAVILAHTLGNPFDLGAVLAFCRQHELWLIEDNCDALGSTYALPVAQARALGLTYLLQLAEAGTHPHIRLVDPPAGARSRAKLLQAPTGAWGDLSTQSFYPPHHLTMGEGGAVNIVSHAPLKRLTESFRDWGRDCWCAPGCDDTCGKRFDWQLGELPRGYDHKYVYSHLGYNLKPIDPQAAIGRRQLEKLPAFIAARQRHWRRLRAGLADLGEFFDFALPTHATGLTADGFTWDTTGCRTECSWFGFMLCLRPGAPLDAAELGRRLDAHRIGHRRLFGGNLLRQPAFVQLRRERPDAVRVVGDLAGADRLMRDALFVGVYPGLTDAMVDRTIAALHAAVRNPPPAS